MMEARNLPAFGMPVLIHELLVCSDWSGKCVNVTGRLDQHDVEFCLATLVDPKSLRKLQVDTTLVEPFSAQLGSLFQFIGELREDRTSEEGNCLLLQARIVRRVDGLDLIMYERALTKQREFLQGREQR